MFHKIMYFPLTKIVIGMVVCIATMMIGQFGSQALLSLFPLSPDLKNGIIGAVIAALVLVVYTFLFRYYEKRPITELSFHRFGRNALIGFFTGLGLQSLVIFMMYVGGGYVIHHVNPVVYLIPGFVIAFTSAIFEEILFRGVLFRILEEKLGSVIALLISASVFGFVHLLNENSSLLSAMAIAIQAGILLGASYMYTRSLWLPIFLHFAWNFAEAGIFGAVISGNTVPKSLFTASFSGSDLLTGGSFGPENSIQATIFCLFAAIVFLWLAKKRNQFIKPFWMEAKTK